MSDELKVILKANELQEYMFVISNKVNMKLIEKISTKINTKFETLNNEISGAEKLQLKTSKNAKANESKELLIFELLYNRDVRINIVDSLVKESIDLVKKLNIVNGVYLDSKLKEV